MNVGSLLSVLLGAVLATLSGMATVLWGQRRDRRVAARLIYQELLVNYGTILSFRMGDADQAILHRLSDRAWQEQSGKLALLQSYDAFQQLWGLYQIFPALSAPHDSGGPTVTIADGVLDSLDVALLTVGASAGIGRQFLDQMRERNQLVRASTGLSPAERVSAWQRSMTGAGLVLPLVGDLGLTPQGETVLFQLPSPVFPGEKAVRAPAPPGRGRGASAGLQDAIRLSLPVVLPVHGDTAAGAGLAEFLAANDDFDFFLAEVVLSVRPDQSRRAAVRAVDLSLDLRSGHAGDAKAPIAWSMSPARVGTASAAQETGVRVQIASLKFELPPDRAVPAATETYIVAAGEGTSSPRWQLRRTAGRAIEGTERFQLVIRTPKAAGGQVAVSVTASAGGRWRQAIAHWYEEFELPAAGSDANAGDRPEPPVALR
jgi:hypothetical protein